MLHSSICTSCRTKYEATGIQCPKCGGREAVCPGCEPAWERRIRQEVATEDLPTTYMR